MSAGHADRTRAIERAALAKYREAEREAEADAARALCPLERTPQNGAYSGPLEVRRLPLGVSYRPDDADAPKRLQSRWFKRRGGENPPSGG